MDTRELETILKKNVSTQKTFLGVFALDQLPTPTELRKVAERRDRWFLVCNCCPASKPGRHWIAIFYERGSVEFFDSFALSFQLIINSLSFNLMQCLIGQFLVVLIG